jgi:hypothetical protein
MVSDHRSPLSPPEARTMSPLVLLAAMFGQAPSPQLPAASPPIAAIPPPQLYLTLQYAAPPIAAAPAPSVYLSSPPVWDRAAAGLGRWLTARATKHHHFKPVTIGAVQTVQPVQLVTQQPAAAPVRAMPQTTADDKAPPPPFLIPDPTTRPALFVASPFR